jgi:ribonucleoside-diphosphate reductase alpha chain
MIESFTKLRNKRKAITTKYVIGNQSLFVTVGVDDEGKPSELFIDMNKEGSTMKVIMHCFAIAVSLGLQYGVPLKRFVEIFSDTKCDPSGYVDGESYSSVIDLIFKNLGRDYL